MPGLPVVSLHSSPTRYRSAGGLTALEAHPVLVPTAANSTTLSFTKPDNCVQRTPLTTAELEDYGAMWKIMGGHPHWDGSQKKMWSPIPRNEAVKLPFLEVTPTTVLERLKCQTPKDIVEEERNPLAIWSTEPIDLARTAPSELSNYRSVYLGKLRQGSAIGRAINSDKGYALHPGIYTTAAVGSARSGERGAHSSPKVSSASPRKLNALEPIDQADLLSASSQSLSIIPPLSTRAKSGAMVKRIPSNDKRDDEMKQQRDELFLRRGTEPYLLNEEENLEEINEETEEFLEEPQDGQSGSAGTRDSGISSVLSPHPLSDVPLRNRVTVKNNIESASDEEENEENYSEDESVVESEEESSQFISERYAMGRNSLQTVYAGNNGPPDTSKSNLRKVSLPVSMAKPAFKVTGKGLSKIDKKSKKGKVVRKKSKGVEFQNFDYESDFESDDEMKAPAKSESDLRKVQEERFRKYKELEIRHSGTSLQPTTPNKLLDEEKRTSRFSKPHLGGSKIPKKNFKSNFKFGRSEKSKPTTKSSNIPKPSQQITLTKPPTDERTSWSDSQKQASRIQVSEVSKLQNTLQTRLIGNKTFLQPDQNSNKLIPLRASNSDNALSLKSRYDKIITEKTDYVSLDDITGMTVTKKPFSTAPKKNFTYPSPHKTASDFYADKFRRELEGTVQMTLRNFRKPEISMSRSPKGSMKEKDSSHRKENTKNPSNVPYQFQNFISPTSPDDPKTPQPTRKSQHKSKASYFEDGLRNSESPPRSTKAVAPLKPSSLHTPKSVTSPPSAAAHPSQKLFEKRSLEIPPPFFPTNHPQSKSPSLPSSFAAANFQDSMIGSACMRKTKPSNSHRNKPFANPANTLQSTLQKLKMSEWEEQVEGIQNIARLSATNPRLLLADLKEINSLLLRHGKNLRSQVSRAALQVIMNLFDDLKKDMEQDLEKLVPHLLQRTSDTNRFLQEDSNYALDAMIENISLSKALGAAIQDGVGHKNQMVRAMTARLIAYAIERIGHDKFFAQKDVCEKALPALAKFAQDGSLETRKYSKMAFQRLGKHSNFESLLKKYISLEEQKNIQKFIDNMYEIRGASKEYARIREAKGGKFKRTL